MQRWFDYYCLCGTGAFCERKGLEFRDPDEADLLSTTGWTTPNCGR